MSKTPLTDAAELDYSEVADEGFGKSPYTYSGFSRRLELERAKLITALTEYIAAGDHSVSAVDDVAAMLRFGEAEKRARSLLARLKVNP